MLTGRKIMCMMLTLSMMVPLASCMGSCNKNDGDSGDPQGGPGGNAGYKETYYSAKLVTLPRKTDELFTFAMEDKACLIGRTYGGGCDDEPDDTETGDYLYVCSYDGQIEKEVKLPMIDYFFYEGACDLDGTKFVAYGGGKDYVIFDYDGNIVRSEEPAGSDFDSMHSACKSEDGFVIAVDDTIRKYDNDGNKIDEIVYDNNSFTISGVLEQDGVCYGYGQDNMSYGGGLVAAYEQDEFSYYKIDFETDTVEQYCTAAELNDIWVSNWYGADYYNYYCADTYGNDLVKIDFANKTTVPLADKGNMLIMPPSYGSGSYSDTSYKFLDETHFYRDYLYHGDGIELAEVALISIDDSLNLADRTKITLQGFGVNADYIIAGAAYDFNTSQDEYFLKLDDLNGQYSIDTDEERDAARTQLMAKYSSGEVPDMFYGDFLDFNYMGENNLVLDIKPYLNTSNLCDKLTRSDGKIYQVFAGYYLQGCFAREDRFDNDVSLSDLPRLSGDQQMFDMKIPSVEVMYNSVGCDLANIYRSGQLTRDNIKAAVQFAVDEGISQEEYDDMNYDEYLYASDVANGRVTLYDTFLGGMSSYYYLYGEFEDYPVFVGYPSFGGSVHRIYPECSMAVSASTPNAEACCQFISTLLSEDVQRHICSGGSIPVNNDVLDEYLDVLQHPDSCTKEQEILYSREFVHDLAAGGWCDEGPVIPLSDEMKAKYLEQIAAGDTVGAYDWGLYLVTKEEINSYYTQGKSVDEVADALYSRYLVYAQENY